MTAGGWLALAAIVALPVAAGLAALWLTRKALDFIADNLRL
jgi:hypothetical protein